MTLNQQLSEKSAKKHGLSLSEYNNVHHWLKYHYGKASKCESKDCKGASKKYEWALLKGKKYENKRENFMWLCKSCHTKYDFTEEGKKIMAQKLKIVSVNKYKPVYAEKDGKKWYFPSLKDGVAELGVSRTGISNNLIGRAKSAGGYVWTRA